MLFTHRLLSKRDYKTEWQVGDDVQFRLKKDKMYLKRTNERELTLDFLLQAKLGPDGETDYDS